MQAETMQAGRTLRQAAPVDAQRIAQLVNRAFIAERWFKSGDRTSEEDIRGLLAKGLFLLLEQDAKLVACVYLEPREDRAYLGMLSVEPDLQRSGLGSRTMLEAENFCRRAGYKTIELRLVNVRAELPPYYHKFGYLEDGIEPATGIPGVSIPVHFIRMTKALEG